MAHPLVSEIADMAALHGQIADMDDRVGYTPGSLRRWKSGQSRMSVDALTDYAQALGYRVELVPIKAAPVFIPRFLPSR